MKTKFFLPLVAALALTGCSDDEPAINGGDENGNGGRFLAVNIVTQGTGSGSRADVSADANDNGSYPLGSGNYEDGTTAENEVKAVRLYFFTSGGDPIAIKKGSNVNYYDIPTDQITTNADLSEDHNQTVEKILSAVVIVESGERIPAKMVAVINPIKDEADGGLGDKSLSLSDLYARNLDYAKRANEGEFIMTNSVYKDGNGLVNATTITAANYATNQNAAKANPVEIYVERTVAKVRVNADKLEKLAGTNLYKLYTITERDKNNNVTGSTDLTIAEKVPGATETQQEGTASNAYNQVPVYLKLDGWDVTADVSCAWFFKHIKLDWQPNHLGSDIAWNDPILHRSFWADVCIPQVGTNMNQYYAYNATDHFKSTQFDGKEGVYCNENAERPAESKLLNTKVLIKGTLCDKNGKPLMVSEYGGSRFVDNDSLEGLKARYIDMFKAMRMELPWHKVTVDGKEIYKQMSTADIRFKAVEYINPADINESAKAAVGNTANTYEYTLGRYYVYPYLTDAAAAYTWYATAEPAADGTTIKPGEVVEAADINKELLKLSHAKVWKGGKTYYYADIQHLGNGNNQGTVRNHIYDISLTKIYGIGTPVYGEELTIIPEKPQNDETFIAARVNILSWRVVSNNVQLEWD